MSFLESITGQQAAAVVQMAADRHAFITATAMYQNFWLSFKSKMLACTNGLLWLEIPPASEGVQAKAFLPEKECGLNFRLNSYRYFFTGTLTGPGKFTLSSGQEIDAFSSQLPQRLDRLERRAFQRVDVPEGRMARASVWVGPNHRPIWLGKLMNISMGGFQMRTSVTALNFFETGDVVNVSLSFGSNELPLTVEAHYRHGTVDGSMCLLGFEFTSLNFTPESKFAFETLAMKVKEYGAV